MEDINLKELFRYFLSHFEIVIVILSIFLVFGNLYSLVLKKPMYKSSTTIVLTNGAGQSGSGITQSDIQLNKSLVNTYSEIIKSRKILSQVIEDMYLSYSSEVLASKVSVTALDNTEIIKIVVVDENTERATQIANNIASVFAKEIQNYYDIQNVAILDEAIVNEKPYNKNVQKDNILYVLVALVLSCGIIFIIFYFDTSIKSKEVVEEKLKLPVLGLVPSVNKE